MKISKRVKALVLIGAISTTVLTGCSNDKKQETATKGNSDYTIKLGYYSC